jgi:hypothetical protein
MTKKYRRITSKPKPRVRLDPATIIGKKYGRWQVVGYAGYKSGQRHFICRCDCGKTFRVIPYFNLKKGRSLSCGCLFGNYKSPKKHGCSNIGDPMYQIWLGVRQRCLNKHSSKYTGWKLCEEWNDFLTFKKDIGEKPKPPMRISLMPIDPELGYCKGNVQWVDLRLARKLTGALTQDEFTDLEVSRQRKWQLRKQKAGKCQSCGKKGDGMATCPKCRKRAKKNSKILVAS